MPFLNYKPLKAAIKSALSRSYRCYGNISCHENNNNMFTASNDKSGYNDIEILETVLNHLKRVSDTFIYIFWPYVLTAYKVKNFARVIGMSQIDNYNLSVLYKF